MPNQLHQHIVTLIPAFESEVEKVLHYFEKQSFPKNHIVINQGSTVDCFYFVLKVCM